MQTSLRRRLVALERVQAEELPGRPPIATAEQAPGESVEAFEARAWAGYPAWPEGLADDGRPRVILVYRPAT